MTEQFKKIFNTREYLKIKVVILFVVIFFAVLWIAGVFRSSEREVQIGDTGGANITSAFDAYNAAFGVAKVWRNDAILSTFISNTAENNEPINTWQFIFISPSVPGKGLLVDIADERVIGSRETNYVGTGAAFSEAGIISQGEAVRRIHALPGYENEQIIGIEAVYDTVKHSWFWAAKTARGVVSVEANL